MPLSDTGLSRRSVLRTGMAAGVVVPSRDGTPLREKFFGCVAGCHIGSSMGERQRLVISAIVEKNDRVTAEDVRAILVRDSKPESAVSVSETFEAKLLAMAKTGIPACDLGRYCDYAGLNSLARSCHPVGLINAGDPESAVTDVFEVGQLYQTTNSRGIQWAAITALAVAAATKPQATLDSVLAAILQGDPRFTPDTGVVREIDRGLKLTAGCGDFHELRKTLDAVYSGTGTNEVVTKAVCVFRFGKGNVRDTLAAAVGMGRDADCVAAISSGLAGALSGGSTIPTELVKQHLRQTSDALYEAYRERLRKMRTYAEVMETA